MSSTIAQKVQGTPFQGAADPNRPATYIAALDRLVQDADNGDAIILIQMLDALLNPQSAADETNEYRMIAALRVAARQYVRDAFAV